MLSRYKVGEWLGRILGKGSSMCKGTEAKGRCAKVNKEVGDKAGEVSRSQNVLTLWDR